MKRFIGNKLLKLILTSKNKEALKAPLTPLTTVHLKNARLLPNRNELLNLLPKNSICAEIGVDKGTFSEKILTHCNPEKLHLIDAWHTERYNENLGLSVERKFEKEISTKRIVINRGLSTDVLKEFPNYYFDWVYIDTDHSYKTTFEELQLCLQKVKVGGIIAGHDYIIGNWSDGVKYGVMEAVHEFCKKEHWEILFLTTELDYPPSFAIKKIDK